MFLLQINWAIACIVTTQNGHENIWFSWRKFARWDFWNTINSFTFHVIEIREFDLNTLSVSFQNVEKKKQQQREVPPFSRFWLPNSANWPIKWLKALPFNKHGAREYVRVVKMHVKSRMGVFVSIVDSPFSIDKIHSLFIVSQSIAFIWLYYCFLYIFFSLFSVRSVLIQSCRAIIELLCLFVLCLLPFKSIIINWYIFICVVRCARVFWVHLPYLTTATTIAATKTRPLWVNTVKPFNPMINGIAACHCCR